jgi:hypothetical protein
VRVAERHSGHAWRRIALELQRLQLITLAGADGTVEQTTPPSPLATQILAAVKVHRTTADRRDPAHLTRAQPLRRTPVGPSSAWAHGHTRPNTP